MQQRLRFLKYCSDNKERLQKYFRDNAESEAEFAVILQTLNQYSHDSMKVRVGGAKRRLLISNFLSTCFARPIINNLLVVTSLIAAGRLDECFEQRAEYPACGSRRCPGWQPEEVEQEAVVRVAR